MKFVAEAVLEAREGLGPGVSYLVRSSFTVIARLHALLAAFAAEFLLEIVCSTRC